MLRLTIVRHAHAHRPDEDTEDFERALDKRGRREARRVAQHLATLDTPPDHLLTSPAVRTVETAKAIAHAVGFRLEKIRHDDRLYLADADTLLAILKTAPAAARHVLVVGHNPGLSVLASRLDADADVGDLPTAAAIALRFPVTAWTALDWRLGKRLLYATPESLGDLP